MISFNNIGGALGAEGGGGGTSLSGLLGLFSNTQAPSNGAGGLNAKDLFMGLGQIMPMLMPKDPTLVPNGSGAGSVGSAQMARPLIGLPGPAGGGIPNLGALLAQRTPQVRGY